METHAVTQLLDAVGRGDVAAAERFWQTVYHELHAMAESRMAAEQGLRTLQPTALVNEVYLKLFGVGGGDAGAARFENRRHFFAAAARAMHQILVDDAHRRGRLKRGGLARTVAYSAECDGPADDPTLVLAVDEAMAKFAQDRPDLVELVRLRFFVGLTLDETAEVLGVARRTIANQWQVARAMLYGLLSGDEPQQ